MDISETYVKMCEKASEIQYEYAVNGFGYSDGHHFFNRKNQYETIWLPRQDQLQELDGRHWREFDEACEYEWGRLSRKETMAATREQVGIRVIMWKYGKTWNGEDWVV